MRSFRLWPCRRSQKPASDMNLRPGVKLLNESKITFCSWKRFFIRCMYFQTDPNDPQNTDIDTKIDELRTAIRKSETSKMKAEARIECLRQGGINVDEFMQELDTLSVQDIPRSGSSLSVRTDASGMGVSQRFFPVIGA